MIDAMNDGLPDEKYCPGCGYSKGCMHAGDPYASDDAPAYPCDGSYFRSRVAAANAVLRAKYAVGQPCTGFHVYDWDRTKGPQYIITRSEERNSAPKWYKGKEFEATWDRLWKEGWSHDHAALDLMVNDPLNSEYPHNRPQIYFEFKRPNVGELSLFGAAV